MKPFYALVALAVIAFVPVAGAATPGKRCLFLHGVGQAGPKTGVLRVGPLGSFEPYFGDLASALSDVCGTVETVEVTTTGLA